MLWALLIVNAFMEKKKTKGKKKLMLRSEELKIINERSFIILTCFTTFVIMLNWSVFMEYNVMRLWHVLSKLLLLSWLVDCHQRYDEHHSKSLARCGMLRSRSLRVGRYKSLPTLIPTAVPSAPFITEQFSGSEAMKVRALRPCEMRCPLRSSSRAIWTCRSSRCCRSWLRS